MMAIKHETHQFKALYPDFKAFETNVLVPLKALHKVLPVYLNETKTHFSFDAIYRLFYNKYSLFFAKNIDQKQHDLMVNGLQNILPAFYVKSLQISNTTFDQMDVENLLKTMTKSFFEDPDTNYNTTETAYSSTPDGDSNQMGTFTINNIKDKNLINRKMKAIRIQEISNYIDKFIKMGEIEITGLVNALINDVSFSSLWEIAEKGEIIKTIKGENGEDGEDGQDGQDGGIIIKDQIIDTPHIKDGAVTTPKIKDGAVTHNKIGFQEISNAKMMDNAISTNKLAPKAVTKDKLSDLVRQDIKDAKTTIYKKNPDGSLVEYLDGDSLELVVNNFVTKSVANEKGVKSNKDDIAKGLEIPDGSITPSKLAGLSVTNTKLNFGAVSTSRIRDRTITENKISDGAITENKISDGAVTRDKIFKWAVIEDKISNSAITEDKISRGAVTEDKIIFGAVTEDKLSSSLKETLHLQDNVESNIEMLDIIKASDTGTTWTVIHNSLNHMDNTPFSHQVISTVNKLNFNFTLDHDLKPGIYQFDFRLKTDRVHSYWVNINGTNISTNFLYQYYSYASTDFKTGKSWTKKANSLAIGRARGLDVRGKLIFSNNGASWELKEVGSFRNVAENSAGEEYKFRRITIKKNDGSNVVENSLSIDIEGDSNTLIKLLAGSFISIRKIVGVK